MGQWSEWISLSDIKESWLFRILIIVIAYSLTGWFGLSVPFAADKVTLFWLPSGIAVAALYRWQLHMWPGVFLGALFINLCTGAPPLVNLIIACGNTLGPIVTLILLRRLGCELHQLKQSTALSFIVATSLGMLAPACIGGTAIRIAQGIDFNNAFFHLYLPWWMGDSLGVLLVTPLLINLTPANLRKLNEQKMSMTFMFVVCTLIACISFPLNGVITNTTLPIAFITFVCVAWAALSFGLIGGATATLGFSFIAIWSTTQHLGPFAFSNIQNNYWLLWLYTSSMTFLSLIITAAHAEIVTTTARLTEANREQEKQKHHLENAQLMARVAPWSWDIESDDYIFGSALCNLFELDPDYLTGKFQLFCKKFIYPEDQTLFFNALKNLKNPDQALSVEFRIEIAGKKYWLHAKSNALEVHQTIAQGTFQDITERKRLDLALAAAAADSASSPDFFNDILIALNEAIGTEHAIISMLDSKNSNTMIVRTYIKNGVAQPTFNYPLEHTPCANTLRTDVCFIPKNVCHLFPQDQMLVDLNIQSYLGVVIKNAYGDPLGLLIVFSEKAIEITDQIRSLMLVFAERISGELRRAIDQDKIFNLAFFDVLTQLPNRRMLLDRLKLIIAQSARDRHHGAVLFIDIDHFKLLNDTRGHHVGDLLLTQVAERIKQILSPTDLAARLGGDEFVVVFDFLDQHEEIAAIQAKQLAEELHDLLNQPYQLQNAKFHHSVSIGVNLFNWNNNSIDDLLRHADMAMYHAKDGGRNNIRFFDPHMQALIENRASLETDLRTAIQTSEELLPYYQVQMNQAGKAIGAELLLRWKHPTKGMISPAEFIPVAEQTGMIISIGKRVIEQACLQLQRWSHSAHFNQLSIAVNVSPVQFNREDFVAEVIGLVNQYKINPQRLKLELTEGSLLKNVDQSIQTMQRLQNAGIDFSLDDFGIGYSSLSYLKRLPLYQLKIDQTFVRDIAIDSNDAIIVRTIIAMAQHMNLSVIAEGVETEEQRSFLEKNGCLLFQGFYFGRPLPIAEFEKNLIEKNYFT